MPQTSTLDAVNRGMLKKALKAVEEMKGLINDCMVQDELLSQQEETLRNQLKEIDLQRMQLNEAIDEYQVALSSMESSVHHFKCMLSPMRRIPSEILLRIFHECVLQEEEHHHEMLKEWEDPDHSSATITLGSVCSHWRTVVTQNTKLWNSVLILQPAKFVRDSQRQKRIAGHWMSHGMQNQQSIFIDRYRAAEQPYLSSILGSSSPQWKSINIALVSSESMVQHWDIAELRASEVAIYRTEDISTYFFLPLLQYASRVTCSGYLPGGDMPWASLKFLTIIPFSGQESSLSSMSTNSTKLRTLLEVAVFLESLKVAFTLEGEPTNPQDISAQEKAEHRNLKSLSFHIHHLDAGGHLFGLQIVAPSLRHLIILSFDHSNIIYDDPLHGICDGVTSIAFCEIQEHNVSSVAGFLRCLPNVTTINVQGQHINALFILVNAFYHALPPRYPYLPIPRLTTIAMVNTDIHGSTLIELVKLRIAQLEGKTPGIAPVAEIKLYDSELVTVEEWKQVNVLLEKGRRLGTDSSLQKDDAGNTDEL